MSTDGTDGGRLAAARAEPSKPRRRLRLRIPYIILLALMALFAYKFMQKTQEIHRLASEASALRWENQQTAQQNAAVQRSLQYYRSNAFVEEQARGILGYTLPGEVLVQSNPVLARVVAVRQAPPPAARPPEPSWKRWWHAFFGG